LQLTALGMVLRIRLRGSFLPLSIVHQFLSDYRQKIGRF
jgi:hypothetical protein